MATEADRLKRIENRITRGRAGVNYVFYGDKLP